MAADQQQKTGNAPNYALDMILVQSANHKLHDLLAILSVYNKTGLLDLAKGLIKNKVRLLASGGTAKLIREAGFPVELVLRAMETCPSTLVMD